VIFGYLFLLHVSSFRIYTIPMSLVSRLKSLDPVVVGLTIGLTVFGLAMLMSATGPVAFQRTGDSLYFVKHQLLVGVLPGSLLFLFFALIDVRRFKRVALLALVLTLALLILVYLPGIGRTIGGARSWVQLGPVGFQPSELVKLTFLFYLAAWLDRREGKSGHEVQTGLLPFLGILGTVMVLLIFQPDTGSMAVIVGMSLLLYFLSGAPLVWFAGLGGLSVGLVALLVRLSPYRAARFMTFLHPELDPKGIGYHINQAMLAIGSGGFWGLGYGHSRQKFLYLPEVAADSIVAVIAEEMGYFIIAVMVVAFGALVWRCLRIARDNHDRFLSYLAAGVGAWIGIQFILNIGSMTGLLPMTGVTLPFISHGGSSMTVLLGAMGLVAGLGKQGRR
jgi:cell division protein FtsW